MLGSESELKVIYDFEVSFAVCQFMCEEEKEKVVLLFLDRPRDWLLVLQVSNQNSISNEN